ncbi:DUF4856 domain-containing protein [Aggregatimonas sangjinii]|uniref:DUF4856 domain-containing protein n=1 Tax=Aggregatimonas sangjinii TaxID=2583587 RepID=A0A5B7SQB2_9FLAO|nr:DUF4856 domain-containing protein [Aggregatimonas sangjinii]QCX00796.1 DUF4856 domain-containing protein [Aggregatimonas sangjinii]
MKRAFILLTLASGLLFTACDSDDNDPIGATCSDGIQNGDETGVDCGGSCTPCETAIENPSSYLFERDGESTVSFSGQTTRLLMGDEILGAFGDEMTTAERIQAMFAHEEGAADFEDADLNASDKSVRSKTAASADFFSSNATDQALIRADFDGWITAQVTEVFPNWNVPAEAGTAGQLADGSSTRYVSSTGLEYNQLFNKGLIGALTADQILNNYLSPTILDEADNRANNDDGVVEEGKSYTTMEHKWDEAYGYVYGLNADASDPNADLGADSFLNKYIGRVEDDTDFAGVADEIFQAFKLGRAAIVAKQYDVRDEQAEIIKQKISEIIGIRAVYYLQQAKAPLTQETPAYGSAFHDLSEGYGFIYSLQFTRKPNATDAYFTKAEVDAFLIDLMDDGENGLWDVTPATLDTIAAAIADRFDFTLEQAAE